MGRTYIHLHCIQQGPRQAGPSLHWGGGGRWHMNKHRKGLWEATAAGPGGQRGRCAARPERGLQGQQELSRTPGRGLQETGCRG